jgi:hypothetical protein
MIGCLEAQSSGYPNDAAWGNSKKMPPARYPNPMISLHKKTIIGETDHLPENDR